MTALRGGAAALGALVLACAAAAVPAAPVQHTVIVDGMAFVPATLRVKRGDRVVWVNKDLVPHTATARSGAFDSGRIASGARWTYVAEQPGTIEYDCAYHPTMIATLVVE